MEFVLEMKLLIHLLNDKMNVQHFSQLFVCIKLVDMVCIFFKKVKKKLKPIHFILKEI